MSLATYKYHTGSEGYFLQVFFFFFWMFEDNDKHADENNGNDGMIDDNYNNCKR